MFRFTIRETFLSVSLIATTLGWWMDRRALVLARNQAFADCNLLSRLCIPGKHIGPETIATALQPIWDKNCAWPRPPEVKAAWAYNRRVYGNSEPSRQLIQEAVGY